MMADRKSWLEGAKRVGRSQLATQAAVLLPVVVLAGLTAWITLSAPTKARSVAAGRSTSQPNSQTVGKPAQIHVAQTAASREQVAATEPPAVDGLKISWQSWHRGGLGSNALISFTLRNDNDYPVKDIEIACAFSQRDGSHVTNRKRVIDAVVDTKSRKTFARVHIGYVNIDANKVKCAPVAASRA